MTAAPITTLLRLLAGAQRLEGSDRQLLERFVADADEAAFASLVDRHGWLVFHLCRSVLHHEQDAEDAFQATFLVLARLASSIRKRDSLASWLHGVALRTALRARRALARRRRAEQQATAPTAPEPVSEAALREMQRILHEEIDHLPAKYRVPFVICCLEGKSRAEAAQLLGWKDGTVSGRIAQARTLLQARLARRGVTLSAALAAVSLMPDLAKASVPVVARVAIAFAAGRTSATLSPSAAILARGVIQAMLLTKLKAITAALLLAFVLAGGGWLARAAMQPEAGSRQAPLPRQSEKRAEGADRGLHTDAFGDPLPPGAVARLGTLRLRSGAGVSFLAFTADGKTLAYAGGGGDVIRLADARTGKDVKTFASRFPVMLERMALSPDGKLLAGGFVNAYDAKQPPIVIWDTATGKKLCQIPRTGFDFVFSSDGKVFVTGGQVWDAATGKKVRDLDRWGEPAFSADGKLLALAGDQSDRDESVFLYETTSWRRLRAMKPAPAGKKVAPGQSRPALTFSPDGKWLVAVTTDGGIRIWKTATGEMVDYLKTLNGDTRSLSISPDSKLLAVASAYSASNRTTIWDLTTRRLLHEIDGARVVAFSPAARRPMLLATGGGAAGGVSFAGVPAVRYWDPLTAREISPNDAPYGAVQLTRFLPGGKLLAVSYEEKGYRLWNWRTGKQLARVSVGDRPLAWAAASTDGKLLASSPWRGFQGEDDTIHLHDLRTGKEIHHFGRNEMSYPFGFASGSRFLLTIAPFNRVTLWDTATGKVARRLDLKKELKGGVNRAVVSADGKSLLLEMQVSVPPPPEITEDRGGFLDLRYYWCKVDLETGKQRWRTGEVKESDALAISVDGKVVACGMPGKIQLRRGDTGALLRELDSSSNVAHPWSRQAGALAFSNDGNKLIAGDGLTNVFVWDVATGKLLHKLRGHRGRVFSISVSPDDTLFATASEDSTVMIWRLDVPSNDRSEKAK